MGNKKRQYNNKALLKLLQENDSSVNSLTVKAEQNETIKDVASRRAESLFDIVKRYGPAVVDFLKEQNKGEKVYCVTKKSMERIAKTDSHFILNSAKDALAPVYRNAKGNVSGHVDLEERFLPSGNPAMAVAMASLSQQLAKIQEQLEIMQESIDDVYQGQWNDRFAKIDAAKNELLIASHIESDVMKKHLLANAIELSCSGENEISRSLKDEVSKCEKMTKWDSVRKAKQQMERLIEHIPALFESWQIKLLLLQESEELPALAVESRRIKSEIRNFFTEERLSVLQDQTHGKEGHWTKFFKEKIDSSIRVLSAIELQCGNIIDYKKDQILIGGNQ